MLCLFRLRCAASLVRAALLALACVALAQPASASMVTPPEFPDLVKRADYIVRVVVKSMRSELTTYANGRKIHTYVELEVLEAIAGTPPSPLVLRLLGGKVGELEMQLQGAPQFAVGEEHILFVRGNGRLAYPLVGFMHGQYPIRREPATPRRYMARSDGVPLQDAVEVSHSVRESPAPPALVRAKLRNALTPEQFIERIKSAAKNRTDHATN